MKAVVNYIHYSSSIDNNIAAIVRAYYLESRTPDSSVH